MAKLRLGVIGAGSWTVSSHLPNLVKHRDEIEFAIVNRRNPDLLEKIKDDFGFEKSTDRLARRHRGEAGHRRGRQPARLPLGAEQGGARSGRARDVREAVHHRPGRTPGTSTRRLARTGKSLILSYGWNYRPMVIQAHRMMHEDGGVGEIEHVALHMDSVTRELLSETGAYPDAAPEYIPQPDTWSRPETSGRRLRPGPADPPARRVAVADRPARPGRVRVHVGAARRQGGAP